MHWYWAWLNSFKVRWLGLKIHALWKCKDYITYSWHIEKGHYSRCELYCFVWTIAWNFYQSFLYRTISKTKEYWRKKKTINAVISLVYLWTSVEEKLNLMIEQLQYISDWPLTNLILYILAVIITKCVIICHKPAIKKSWVNNQFYSIILNH